MGTSGLHSACMALSMLLSSASIEADESRGTQSNGDAAMHVERHSNERASAHLRPDSRIADMLGTPAFAGFGRLLLPWDNRAYDETMRLGDIGSLLPYHSHVDPTNVVSALNRMIDDVNKGETIFYDFYTEAQKREDPTKENTSLFFFRGKPGAPFAVVSPGGGFAYVGSVHEGFPYASEISSRGYNVFVLRYRAGYGARVATEDLAGAISYIFKNAGALGVGIRDYSLWGSSAGARMAAAIGSHGGAAFGADDLPRPSAVVTAYTGHSDHSSTEPPTFGVVGEQDRIAPPSLMKRRIAALRQAGAEVEYHKYKGLGHGFGPGIGTSAEGWIADAIRFWERHMKNSSHQLRRNAMGKSRID
ncbi:alpha/beta hydrolase [Rhizobium rhizogenes]|uniref:alpha/beta hydrolase n=1 Tax=Rhizobium rhizogenes TaxID=359 RepID=UPI001F420320|nr:alpha/beta hydrolase [Rhizobium rhizogenes]